MICKVHNETFEDECPKCVEGWFEEGEEEEKPEKPTGPDMRLFAHPSEVDRMPQAKNPFMEGLG